MDPCVTTCIPCVMTGSEVCKGGPASHILVTVGEGEGILMPLFSICSSWIPDPNWTGGSLLKIRTWILKRA